jgi:Alkylmercury lyase
VVHAGHRDAALRWGLTIKEIERLASAYLSRPDEPIGPHLAALPDGSEQRIDDRIAELMAVRERIRDYRARHAAALARSFSRTRSDCCPTASPWRSSGSPRPPDGPSKTSRPRWAPGPAPSATARDDWSGSRSRCGPPRTAFTVRGRTLFAWCASDTLMLPVVLGRAALVESTCVQTGQRIRFELAPDGVERVDPPDAVMSAVRPPGQLPDVRSATCAHGHFFSSIAATAARTDAHPDGHVYPVQEAFRLDREVIRQLGWDARPGQAD